MESLNLHQGTKPRLMNTSRHRDELREYIDKADDRFIHLVYGMMQADMEEGYELSEAHKKILDERLAEHQKSPQSGSSWKDVKSRIEKQL
jgi:putative addiction module component (TIGR02574 family)